MAQIRKVSRAVLTEERAEQVLSTAQYFCGIARIETQLDLGYVVDVDNHYYDAARGPLESESRRGSIAVGLKGIGDMCVVYKRDISVGRAAKAGALALLERSLRAPRSYEVDFNVKAQDDILVAKVELCATFPYGDMREHARSVRCVEHIVTSCF